MIISVGEEDIDYAEKMILPPGCFFSEAGGNIIKCMTSKEVVACPGSGKTTLLMAKLLLLADKSPLGNNCGICVLSHTNVAVDEIKKRLGDKSRILLNYPNYVGTIQSFMHKFIVFPYLGKHSSKAPEVLDNARYAESLFRTFEFLCEKKILLHLKGLVKRNTEQSSFTLSQSEYLSSLYIDLNDSGNLKARNSSKSLAGCDKKANEQFIRLKNVMKKMGIISYNDAYDLANEAVSEYGEELKVLLQARFQYIFVDEYQDCSVNQSSIIDYLFAECNCVLQKIGDCDQAIYSSFLEDENTWTKSHDCLELSGSIRYHQKIANQVSRLRLDDIKIKSLANIDEVRPILIIFNDTSIGEVIPNFAKEIIKNNLIESTNGIFKAVGMIKNGAGLTIDKYWSGYQKEDIQSKKQLCLDDYLHEMYLSSRTHDASMILKQVNGLFHRVFMLLEIKDTQGLRVTTASIYKMLCDRTELDYNQLIIELVKIIGTDENEHRFSELRDMLIQKIETVSGQEIEKVRDFLTSTSLVQSVGRPLCKKNNLWEYQYGDQAIEIEVSTVHKVKGETHAATLYLETETSRSSDLKRIMPLFQGKKALKANSNIHEKSRKIAYVGMSRPTNLLCVAMHSNTYAGNEKYFLDWDVKILSDDKSQTN